MIIKKFQQGGGFLTWTPIINTMPTATPTTGVAASAAKKNTSILDDDTYKELISQGGLVNEVNGLVNELIKLESVNDNPYTASSNRGLAIRMIGKVNELKRNKANWDSAVATAKAEGGLGEVAVGAFNEVYTKDLRSNKVKAISLQEYAASGRNERLLTVSELMNERQYNPQLSGQNQIFTVAENAIGMEKINKNIKSMIDSLGTEKTTEDKYVSKEQLAAITGQKPTNDQVESLSNLKQMLDKSEGYLKVTTATSSERKHIDKALNYIWNTLGSPAQQKLSAVAVINGVNNPKQFILDMLQAGTDESISVTTDIIKQPKSAEAEAKEKLSPVSPQELFHNDMLYRPGMTYELNNPNAKVSLKMTATGIGPLFSLAKTGQVVGPTTITNVLTSANYQAILDPNKAFVGDTKVNHALLSEMAFTGGDTAKVYMPVKPDGSPDLAQMEKFSKAYEIFNANKNHWTTNEAQRFFAKSGFSGVVVKDTRLEDGSTSKVIAENGRVKPFLALPIITNSASDLSDNAWMTKSTGDNKSADEQLMNAAFTTLEGTPSKPKYINKMPSKWNALENPYRGTVFVAYRDNASAILKSTMGHLIGRSGTEADLYRNLNFSSADVNPIGVQASSSILN